MGGGGSKEEAEREKEDIFKAIFRSMLEKAPEEGKTFKQVTKDSSLSVEQFIAGIKGSTEALEMIATLGDIGSNIRHKALAKGDDEALKALFASMDTNSDGALTWAEWSKYMGTRRGAITKKLFDKLDKEGKGSVETAALLKALQDDEQLYKLYDLGRSSAKMLVSKLDANGDGVVTKEELTTFISEISAAAPPRRPSMVGK